jgi:hypothetical protein|tara:strand:- start:6973 stop:7140 length:168 start_codon:yes stop_codon:yes gene_type:complete
MSKDITITLSKDLQEEFESYLDCCDSLDFAPRINAFLNYIHNYGTCKNPREPKWD